MKLLNLVTKLAVSLFLLISIVACNSTSQEKADNTPRKEKDFLYGLTELEPQDYDSLSKVGLFGAGTVPFYSEDGELIPISKRMEILSSGNYSTTIYVDSNKNINLWTVRLMTNEEKRKVYDTTIAQNQNKDFLNKNAIPFKVKDLNGQEYSLDNLKGKIIVMNFWFLGCYPCVHEIPELNKLVSKYGSNEVVFLAFALDKKEKLETFLKQNSFNYKIIPESKSIHEIYGISACPTQVIIDQESKIRYHSLVSVRPDMENEIEKEIKKLITKGKK